MLVSGSVTTVIMTEVMHTDTDSLVRLNNNTEPSPGSLVDCDQVDTVTWKFKRQ